MKQIDKKMKKKFVETLDCDDLCFIDSVKTKDNSKESKAMRLDVEEQMQKKKCNC